MSQPKEVIEEMGIDVELAMEKFAPPSYFLPSELLGSDLKGDNYHTAKVMEENYRRRWWPYGNHVGGPVKKDDE
jgi:hypothetical protein